MIVTSARVISIANGNASVEPTEQSGCGGCRSKTSCAVSGLGKYFSNNRQAIAVQCDASVRPGDELRMTMSEVDFLKAGILAYLLPSLFTIIGAGLAATLEYKDAGAVIGALLGFASGLLLVRLINWAPSVTVAQITFNEGDTP